VKRCVLGKHRMTMFPLTFRPALPDMHIGERRTCCWSVCAFLSRPGLTLFAIQTGMSETPRAQVSRCESTNRHYVPTGTKERCCEDIRGSGLSLR
jgi:hypothetical protein